MPGHSQTPRDLIKEAQDAEALGFGSVWLSERFDVKEAGVCIGAAAAVTESIYLGTAATNINTRHIMGSGWAGSANRLVRAICHGVSRGLVFGKIYGANKVTISSLKSSVS